MSPARTSSRTASGGHVDSRGCCRSGRGGGSRGGESSYRSGTGGLLIVTAVDYPGVAHVNAGRTAHVRSHAALQAANGCSFKYLRHVTRQDHQTINGCYVNDRGYVREVNPFAFAFPLEDFPFDDPDANILEG